MGEKPGVGIGPLAFPEQRVGALYASSRAVDQLRRRAAETVIIKPAPRLASERTVSAKRAIVSGG